MVKAVMSKVNFVWLQLKADHYTMFVTSGHVCQYKYILDANSNHRKICPFKTPPECAEENRNYFPYTQLYSTISRNMEPPVTWNHRSHGTTGHMEPPVTWNHRSHGTTGHMEPPVTWNHRSHGTTHSDSLASCSLK